MKKKNKHSGTTLKKFLKEEGLKFDEGKVRHDLIPSRTLNKIAEVLEMGAHKYGEYNWLKGMKWSRLLAASLRHLHSFKSLEDFDKESGKLHLYHAIVNLIFLSEYYERKVGEDDRKV